MRIKQVFERRETVVLEVLVADAQPEPRVGASGLPADLVFEEGERRFPGDAELLMGTAMARLRMGDFAVSLAQLDQLDDESIEAIHQKEDRYAQLVGSADYLSGRFWADAWCAAFVWKKTKPSPLPPAGERIHF